MEKKERKKPVGYYNYTVILTYVGFCAGFYGIVQAVSGNVYIALICLMISGVCDMFDGTIAAMRERTKEEKAFGSYIDSLSDMVCFGLLPGSILYGFGVKDFWGYAVMIFFALAALIRLAYFDVQELFADRKEGEKRTHFIGLPVTNAAIFLPGLMAIDLFVGLDYSMVYLAGLVLVGAAFVTPFKMKKLYMPWLLIPAFIGLCFFAVIIIFGGKLNP